jgi:hypothetical protein
MVNLDVAELRPKLDLEGKYVDFSVLRTALAVVKVVRDLDVSLSEPNKEGECRGTCPKCQKERSFSLNINTNRFNCFAKGCTLKGGGVIDFCAKLFEVPAKEASHLVACAYGIQPYAPEDAAPMAAKTITPIFAPPDASGEVASPPAIPAESSGDISQDTRQTAQYLIASIERQFAELKQLLATR